MRSPLLPSRAVVVGIDGSQAAITAALWAVEEAVSRDIPLRLVYAIEPREPCRSAEDAARDLATAELAVRAAMIAVESTELPVKIEVEIAQESAVRVLRELSYSAVLLCLGALGLEQAAGRQIGSTATVLANSANCPVAIVRTVDQCSRGQRWVVVEFDESPDSHDVLERAVAEAVLRKMPLRVLTAWQSQASGMPGTRAVAQNKRNIQAQQERLLAHHRTHHAELDAEAVAVHGSALSYLSRHAASVELLVIGRRRAGGVAAMVGPTARSTPGELRCSVLICPASQAL